MSHKNKVCNLDIDVNVNKSAPTLSQSEHAFNSRYHTPVKTSVLIIRSRIDSFLRTNLCVSLSLFVSGKTKGVISFTL